MGLATVRAYLRAPSNALGLTVRRTIAWRRGPPMLADEAKHGLFDYLPPRQRSAAERRERELRARYDLGPLWAASRRIDYQENLYLLDALESAAPDLSLPAASRALDVGSKNWSYAFALQRFLARAGATDLDLCGVEIDAHTVYADLRSRHDYAQAYIAQTGADLRFRAADVLTIDEPEQDLVTCFYPFLSRYALLQWGLPLRCFQPEAFVARLGELLRPGGHLLVFTQTTAEAERLLELLPAGLSEVTTTPLQSRLVPYWQRTWHRRATLLRRGR